MLNKKSYSVTRDVYGKISFYLLLLNLPAWILKGFTKTIPFMYKIANSCLNVPTLLIPLY